MREKVKALWKRCFNDSEAFTDLYFRLRYSNEINVSIQSGEEVISALQTIPYPMTFAGKVLPTAYVSGACTHPDYRGKGVMRELLGETFARLCQKGIPLSTLIPAEPWLFDYYSRVGYSPVFRYTAKRVAGENCTPSATTPVVCTTQFNERHYQYLHGKLAAHPCCVQHTPEDYRVVLQALALTNDAVYVAMQHNRIAGLAVVWKEENSARAETFFAENKVAEQSLLYHIYKVTRCNDITVQLPPGKEGDSHAIGMIRIVQAEAVLALYAAAHPEITVEFELVDDQLSVNDGYYFLDNGQCRRTYTTDNPAMPRISIAQLTQELFAPEHPYLNMMLN